MAGTNYLKLAADNGDGAAQALYGCFLEIGLGVPVNTEAARHYYKLANSNGMSEEDIFEMRSRWASGDFPGND